MGDGNGEDAGACFFDVVLVGQGVEAGVGAVEVEESDGFAGFEVGVGFVVGDIESDGEDHLVEGVVGYFAEGDGVAAGGFLDLGDIVCLIERTGIGFLFVMHFEPQQFGLFLQCVDG